MAEAKKPTPPEEKLRATYFAIGVAITQWQQVEQSLAQLFVILVNAQQGRAASAAFASVLSFRTKLAMVNYAAQVVLETSPLLAEWTSLNNRLAKKSMKRNEIAHFMLHQKPVLMEPGKLPDITQIDFYLQPSGFDGAYITRYDGNPPQLTANDLQNRARSFQAISKEVWNFAEKVRSL